MTTATTFLITTKMICSHTHSLTRQNDVFTGAVISRQNDVFTRALYSRQNDVFTRLWNLLLVTLT